MERPFSGDYEHSVLSRGARCGERLQQVRVSLRGTQVPDRPDHDGPRRQAEIHFQCMAFVSGQPWHRFDSIVDRSISGSIERIEARVGRSHRLAHPHDRGVLQTKQRPDCRIPAGDPAGVVNAVLAVDDRWLPPEEKGRDDRPVMRDRVVSMENVRATIPHEPRQR